MFTYHIITIGCQMNKSDSERLASVFEKRGFKWTENKYKADLVAVNTCGVRQSAEDRIYGLIPKIKKENPKVKIVLTGCLVKREDVRKRLEGIVDIWLPIGQISNFKFLISKIPPTPPSGVLGTCFVKGEKCDNYLKIKPSYESKFSAFVPIGNGCNNFCSYCVVPYARGREAWRPAKDILGEVESLAENGYKEIVLIAQNVNSYKSDKIDFADLLKLANNIPGDFWIRFATSHPKDISDKLIGAVAECEKVCRHIHLPAQAGDDEVLVKMNRKYKAADYVKLVKQIRKQLNPPVSITTDIIVGFPGETKKQFNNTAKLMRQAKFDLAYIARYSPRPGTVAAKMADNVPKAEKKRREIELMKILRKTALDNNQKYMGKIVEILVAGKNKKGEFFGSTETAKTVKITTSNFNQRLPRRSDQSVGAHRNDKLVGEFVNVKINKVRDFGLEGEIIKYEV